MENRLVGASTGAALRYDPAGRLWQTSAPGHETIRYLYDGDALVAEYDASGNQVARYVHGPSAGTDDPMIWYGGASVSQANRRYLIPNHQGSIVAVADGSGAVIAINRYDEYGIPAATNQGRFQYTGQIWLPELGMYYYKARVYSPTLGPFLQTDPVGYSDQFNLYAYVGNDPINLADPSGMCGTGSRAAEAIGADAVGCNVMVGFSENGTSSSGTKSASQTFRSLARQNNVTQEDPQSRRYNSERAAARGWSQRWGRIAGALSRNQELVSRLLYRMSPEGPYVYSFTLPHAVTLRVNMYGEPIPFRTTFDVASIGWRSLRAIHSHPYPGGGFSAGDIEFARGRGNYLWEPGEGGGILRYLSPRSAETAEAPAQGTVVCARVNECEE